VQGFEHIRLNLETALKPKLKVTQNFFNKNEFHLKYLRWRILFDNWVFGEIAREKHEKLED
jgi:hypothetical protein